MSQSDLSTNTKPLTPEEHDVFLSFGFADRATCDYIYATIKSRRFHSKRLKVWRCIEQISDGDFQRVITEAMERSRLFVALLSKASQRRGSNAAKEVKVAVERQSLLLQAADRGESVKEFPIIIFHLDAAPVSPDLRIPLADLHRINAGTANWKAGIPQLIDAIDKALARIDGNTQKLLDQQHGFLRWYQSVILPNYKTAIRILFSLVVTAAIAAAMWWKLQPHPQPIAQPPPLYGIIEIAPTEVRAIATSFNFHPNTRLASEPEDAKQNRLLTSTPIKVEYDQQAHTFKLGTISNAIFEATRLRGLIETRAGRRVEWLIVLNSVFGSMSKSTKAINDLTHQIVEQLKCDVACATLQDESECLFESIVPASERLSGSCIALDVGPSNIKGCYYDIGLPPAPAPRYYVISEDIPGTDFLHSTNTSSLPLPEYDKAVRVLADSMIADPLHRFGQGFAAFENKKKVYIVGEAVRAMCRIAKPGIPTSRIDVELDWKGDIKTFREILLQTGDDFVNRLSFAKLPPEQQKEYELDRRQILSLFSPDQLIVVAAVLNAVDRGLDLGHKNRKTIFRQNNQLFAWPVEFLRRQLDARNKVSAVTRRRAIGPWMLAVNSENSIGIAFGSDSQLLTSIQTSIRAAYTNKEFA